MIVRHRHLAGGTPLGRGRNSGHIRSARLCAVRGCPDSGLFLMRVRRVDPGGRARGITGSGCGHSGLRRCWRLVINHRGFAR
jgi:hypothetical protein